MKTHFLLHSFGAAILICWLYHRLWQDLGYDCFGVVSVDFVKDFSNFSARRLPDGCWITRKNCHSHFLSSIDACSNSVLARLSIRVEHICKLDPLQDGELPNWKLWTPFSIFDISKAISLYFFPARKRWILFHAYPVDWLKAVKNFELIDNKIIFSTLLKDQVD